MQRRLARKRGACRFQPSFRRPRDGASCFQFVARRWLRLLLRLSASAGSFFSRRQSCCWLLPSGASVAWRLGSGTSVGGIARTTCERAERCACMLRCLVSRTIGMRAGASRARFLLALRSEPCTSVDHGECPVCCDVLLRSLRWYSLLRVELSCKVWYSELSVL